MKNRMEEILAQSKKIMDLSGAIGKDGNIIPEKKKQIEEAEEKPFEFPDVMEKVYQRERQQNILNAEDKYNRIMESGLPQALKDRALKEYNESLKEKAIIEKENIKTKIISEELSFPEIDDILKEDVDFKNKNELKEFINKLIDFKLKKIFHPDIIRRNM